MLRTCVKCVLCTLLVLGLMLGVGVLVIHFKNPPADGFKYNSTSRLGRYKHGAVSTVGADCAPVGRDILKRNGTAVDAAVAILFCEDVANPQSLGLGGGFQMTIYDAANDKAEYLVAREKAPAAAHKDMFGGNVTLAYSGGLTIAVPGQLMGLWEAHKKYGRLPWKDLIEPTIKLCHKGGYINDYLIKTLYYEEAYVRKAPSVAEILIDPKTNKLYQVGQRLKRPKLAKTLRVLADSEDPTKIFYKGYMAKQMVREIQEAGGIITEEDFANYNIEWRTPIKAKIGNLTMYTSPPPGSGALLTLMMNVLNGIVPHSDDKIMWQRFVETFKWAFAGRTGLADPNFVDVEPHVRKLTSKEYADHVRSQIYDNKTFKDPEHYGAVYADKDDHGTAHIAVLAPDGSAVSVTSTINQFFGSKVRSETGVILNCQMDDFADPKMSNSYGVRPSPNNFIEPGKRPLSSVVPTIVLGEDKKVRLVIGASGGPMIPTSTALVMSLHLWGGWDLKTAIDAYRLHHQLFPMVVQHQPDFPEDIVRHMEKLGHGRFEYDLTSGSAVCAVANIDGEITANADYRRLAENDGF